jgi:HEAT repeat protein
MAAKGFFPGAQHFAGICKYGNFGISSIKMKMVHVKGQVVALCLSAAMVALAPFAVGQDAANAPDRMESAPAAAVPPASTPATQPTSSTASALSILQNSALPQEQRDAAALKLVATRDNSMIPVLAGILGGPDLAAQLSVARALGAIDWPAPEFIEPLFGFFVSRQAQQERVQAAAAALSQYKQNMDVLNRLIIVANSNQGDDIRLPVIQAIGSFDQKIAAKTLIELQQRSDSAAVERAAGDALMEMTGLENLDHNAQAWSQWWSQNTDRSEADFQADIRQHRADAFEAEVARNRLLRSAVEKLLTGLYNQTDRANRADLLVRYLRSASPKIRALGATLVLQARSTPDGAPPGTLVEIRGMLDDASPDVRAAVAEALFNDADSADAMVQQLQREKDDMVRATLLHSLTPLRDPAAVALMIKLVVDDPSLRVRIESADGIANAAGQGSLDADTRAQVHDALLAALKTTGEPGTQVLRAEIVAAMAALKDSSFLDAFQRLLAPSEPKGVRRNALAGIGELKDPNMGDLIAGYMDDQDPDIRLAAVLAMGTVVQPEYKTKLIDKMSADQEPAVREAAWDDLQKWMPSMEESDLADLADRLKTLDVNKQLTALVALRDRLNDDLKNAANPQQAAQKAKDLATVQQNIGDVAMSVGQYPMAAEQYRAALTYWQSGNAQPAVITTLSGNLVQALLKAKKYGDAADFTCQVLKEQNNTEAWEAVSSEFKLAGDDLLNSDDPAAYQDATQFFAAIKGMNPQLPGSYMDQLNKIQHDIEAKHSQRGALAPGS